MINLEASLIINKEQHQQLLIADAAERQYLISKLSKLNGAEPPANFVDNLLVQRKRKLFHIVECVDEGQ